MSPSATVAITAPSVSRGVRGSSWARLNSLVCAQPSARTRGGDDGLGDPAGASARGTTPCRVRAAASAANRNPPATGEPSTQGGRGGDRGPRRPRQQRRHHEQGDEKDRAAAAGDQVAEPQHPQHHPQPEHQGEGPPREPGDRPHHGEHQPQHRGRRSVSNGPGRGQRRVQPAHHPHHRVGRPRGRRRAPARAAGGRGERPCGRSLAQHGGASARFRRPRPPRHEPVKRSVMFCSVINVINRSY